MTGYTPSLVINDVCQYEHNAMNKVFMTKQVNFYRKKITVVA